VACGANRGSFGTEGFDEMHGCVSTKRRKYAQETAGSKECTGSECARDLWEER
jgi:hypothetical protein